MARLENGSTDILERIDSKLKMLISLNVAQMMAGERTSPWTQKELIVTLGKCGVPAGEIAQVLGTTTASVYPELSRHRKAKSKTKSKKGADKKTT